MKQGNKRGTIVFATAGPNTRTTQLFINLKDNAPARRHGLCGLSATVTEGMEVVDQIYSGYGEGRIRAAGPTRPHHEGRQAYLDKNFPQLDSIKSAVIIFPERPAAPPAKKAAPRHQDRRSGSPPRSRDPAPAPAKKQ